MGCTPMSPPPSPVRAALAACPPLADLPPEVVDATAERVWMRTLTADEALYRMGDPGDAMFVVASGRIATRLCSPDGDEVDIEVVRGGMLFGYPELLDGGPRSADAVAVAPSRVVVIGEAPAGRLFASSPHLMLVLAREMARTIRGHVDAVHEQAFYPAQSRLARFLLAAAEADGRVRLDGPQVLLARRLGVARQTLSRSLHRLATSGLVRVDASGRVVTILDRDGLAVITELPTRRSSVRPRAGGTPRPDPGAPGRSSSGPSRAERSEPRRGCTALPPGVRGSDHREPGG